jgi:IclR family transcriptional regulator, KDG regulon repressor
MAQLNVLYEYKTIKDLARIFSFFVSSGKEELSVSEISKNTALIPSKVSRILRTLEGKDYFQKNLETAKYRLGIAAFELGMTTALNFPLRKIIRPHIEQIVKELNLAGSWAIRIREKVFVIDRIQNLNLDLIFPQLELNVPIYSSSLGKIFLAYLPESEQDQIFRSVALQKLTPATVVNIQSIKKNLKMIREKGFSLDIRETHDEIFSIGAPIKDRDGEVTAAICATSDLSNSNLNRIEELGDYLKRKGLFISSQLGYRG